MPNDAFDKLEKPRYMDVFPAGCSKDLENKHVEYDGLRDYLIDMLSKIGGQKAANGVMDGDILNLAILCQMLWNEKEKWRGAWGEMAKRYNDHLDKEMEQYKKVLGRHMARRR